MMETQVTVRVPAEMAGKIRERARRMRLKRSDIIRMALAEFLEERAETDHPYERVKHLVGSIRSGKPTLRRREDLIQKIRQHNFRD